MVELVYFGSGLCNRAPDVLGRMYSATGKEWVANMQVVEAVKLGITVTIRPATDAERKRAEALTALYEIGQQIRQRVDNILEQDTPESAQEARQSMAAEFLGAPNLRS
jgi:hypothetical protein